MRLLRGTIELWAVSGLALALSGVVDAIDATLIGGLGATAFYIMAASMRRYHPVAPDKHFWIGGADHVDGDGDGGDGDGDD